MSSAKDLKLISEATDLMARGESKLNEFVMPLFGSKSLKYEEAAEIFEKAGNTFKRAKQYNESSNAFKQAAKCHLRLNNKYDAAGVYVKASGMMKKESVPIAIELLHLAIELYVDEGRFLMAAKHHIDLAELYEEENDFVRAKQEYRTGAEYYEDEGNPATGRKSLLKVAEIAATMGEYPEAIEIFETVGRDSLSNELTQFSAKKHFFAAGLSVMCTLDTVAIKRALDNYSSICNDFARSVEYNLLEGCVEAMEEVDPKAFAKASAEYDRISNLTPWQTSLLIRVKDSILQQDEESSSSGLK